MLLTCLSKIIYVLPGALAAIFAGLSSMNWGRWGEIILGIGAFFQCALLLTMSYTDVIWVSYGCYILFIAMYNFVITIAQ